MSRLKSKCNYQARLFAQKSKIELRIGKTDRWHRRRETKIARDTSRDLNSLFSLNSQR